MYGNNQFFLITQEQLKNLIEEVMEAQINKLKNSLVMDNCLMTRNQAAEEVRKNPNTISRWIKNGILTNRGLGKQILISKNELLGIKDHKSDDFLNLKHYGA